jgi:hypothetical protein
MKPNGSNKNVTINVGSADDPWVVSSLKIANYSGTVSRANPLIVSFSFKMASGTIDGSGSLALEGIGITTSQIGNKPPVVHPASALNQWTGGTVKGPGQVTVQGTFYIHPTGAAVVLDGATLRVAGGSLASGFETYWGGGDIVLRNDAILWNRTFLCRYRQR